MKSTVCPEIRTKIVCTLGPATASPAVVKRLIKEGMNVARFNLSHGDYGEHASHIALARRTAASLSIPLAIMLDIPGPKYRVGKLSSDGVVLKEGDYVTLGTNQSTGDRSVIPVNLPMLPGDVEAGDTVFLDDGAFQIEVVGITEVGVECRVMVGGVLTSGRGIVIPGKRLSVPFITEHLRKHLAFAAAQQPDFIALSFVSQSSDVSDVRDILRGHAVDIPLIAKIERQEALNNFDSILEVSDAVMVARGDLGVDIPLERVPLEQKRIISLCNSAGKPVITATQMLESMVHAPRPTRAEVTDVANAIFDGSDAIMLSAETSIGKYPVQAARMMFMIARQTEAALPYGQMLAARAPDAGARVDDIISYNACYAAQQINARAIVAFTESGSTARRVSRYRPKVTAVAITPNEDIVRQLLLCWGIYPFQVAKLLSVEELFLEASRLVKELGLAEKGDTVVVTGGLPLGVPGSTNLLKVEEVT